MKTQNKNTKGINPVRPHKAHSLTVRHWHPVRHKHTKQKFEKSLKSVRKVGLSNGVKSVGGLNGVKYIKFRKESDLPLSAISLANTRYNKTGKWRSIRPTIEGEKCISCMICWKFCPDAAIEIVDGKPYINLDYCKGCAICAEECPANAIKLKEEKK